MTGSPIVSSVAHKSVWHPVDERHCNKIMGLQANAESGEAIDMEACFSQLTLDVIGKSVFNYDFDALTADSPLIQVRHIP